MIAPYLLGLDTNDPSKEEAEAEAESGEEERGVRKRKRRKTECHLEGGVMSLNKFDKIWWESAVLPFCRRRGPPGSQKVLGYKPLMSRLKWLWADTLTWEVSNIRLKAIEACG